MSYNGYQSVPDNVDRPEVELGTRHGDHVHHVQSDSTNRGM
jgi:hypothetical protein